MEVTYERGVEHCLPSTYVKEYTVKEVVAADNSDNLDVIRFEENWYQAVVSRGSQSVGNKVMFIPPEAVLPKELSDLLGVTNYLGKGRVKEAKLRGNLSQGLVVDKEKVEPFLPYIMQWEDLPTVGMAGEMLPYAETPQEFIKFFKMPSLKNEPDTFSDGEEVFYSEKLHGTNCRFGSFKNPATGEYQLYVGTHETVQRESDTVYWQSVRNALKKAKRPLPNDIEFFCEVYGTKIQGHKFGYDVATGLFKLRVFNAFTIIGGRCVGDMNLEFSIAPPENYQGYLNLQLVKDMCEEIGLESVAFDKGVFKGKEWVESLADAPSEFGNEVREGVVLVSAEDPNKMAKFISSKYLALKGRKERH